MLTNSGCAGTILTASAFRHSATDYEGALSLKWMVCGQARYTTADGGRFLVEPGGYLLLNDGQRYTIEIDAPADEKVESFVPFFAPGLASAVLADLITPADHLLDDPFDRASQPLSFLETTYPDDDSVAPALRRLRRASQSDGFNAGELDERLHDIMFRLLALHRGISRTIEAMPASRHSTRLELFRRLTRARDFIDATLSEEWTLPQIAQVACLSQYHFLREFTSALGETPIQYRTRKRLLRAAHLLRHTDRSITVICLDVGFTSLGSFSDLFRRRFGVPPSRWRSYEISNFQEAAR